MKILKIKILNLPLFAETLEVNFYASQRVSKEKNEMLTNIYSNNSTNIYTNNVLSFIGINASGKTSTLKAISFVIQMLKNKPINSIGCNSILNGLSSNEEICFESYFCDGDFVYKLETYIKKSNNVMNNSDVYVISKEFIWSKSMKSIKSKDALFDFNENNIKEIRNSEDSYLLDDVSIIVGHNKKNNTKIEMIDSIEWTNINSLRMIGTFPLELIRFLDPSIEYLEFKNEVSEESLELTLKFLGKEELFLNSPLELTKHLSSGTIKGINVFIAAMMILQSGGYLIVDELENHFNIEIVSTLIKFFTDSTTNKNGATILFSTHYTELIDILERNDCVYVSRNIGGVSTKNLCDILDRNDVKKSEWFQSGYLKQTTPSYQGYIDFKRKLIRFIRDGEV